MKKIMLVIPVFNEAGVIVTNLNTIIAQVYLLQDVAWQILLVDDGSNDGLLPELEKHFELGKLVYYLKLNRNFGKEAAISAGLAQAVGCDAAIVMDSDLQHPPQLLPKMVELWQKGIEVVEACKQSRGHETLVKGVGAKIFYKLFGYCTGINIDRQSDFKLLDKKVVAFYNNLSEKDRFFRGLIHWMNFSTAQVYFDVPESTRHSAWSTWGLFRYAIRSVTSFTSFPLQIVTLCGGLTFLLSFVLGIIALADKLSGRALDGFSTVILLILIIGSVLMFSLGLIGIYIARIYDEVKRRPSYVIDEGASVVKNLHE
jgi:polyisoprenyl-phosphate glycosyltransferase